MFGQGRRKLISKVLTLYRLGNGREIENKWVAIIRNHISDEQNK